MVGLTYKNVLLSACNRQVRNVNKLLSINIFIDFKNWAGKIHNSLILSLLERAAGRGMDYSLGQSPFERTQFSVLSCVLNRHLSSTLFVRTLEQCTSDYFELF